MTKTTAIIIGTSALTFLIRYLPMRVLYQRKLSEFLKKLFFYLPIAVLFSFAVQAVFLKDGQLNLNMPDKIYQLSIAASILVGMFIRNVGLIIAGAIITAVVVHTVF